MNRPFPTIRIILMAALVMLTALASAAKDFTVIIDAGHGGHDIGAPGVSANEKDINLGVALKLGRMLSRDKGVKVVYTRSTDKFVPLQNRADIANRAKGDLFISIHTNSLDSNVKGRASTSGASVYTLGLDRTDDNLAVAMRENAVMKLENDYTATYQGFDPSSAESYIIFELNQNRYMQQSIRAASKVMDELVKTAGRKNNGVRQANFWVLLQTAMPAMLVELDFICNPTQESYLSSSRGQKQLAEAIYKGVKSYRSGLPSSKGGTLAEAEPGDKSRKSKTPSDTFNKNKKTAADNSAVVYKIQFLTSPRNLKAGSKEFHGLKPVESYRERSTYKYTYGSFPTEQAASADLAKVRKHFPDAFVIKTRGGKRIP